MTSLLLYGNPLGGNGSQTWYAALSGRLLTVDISPNDPQQVVENINPANPAGTYTALAAAFYNLPIGIYQYLVNTIQYQPYQGAMKGPLAVLQTGAGNDWDTNSLLAAALAQVSQQAVAEGYAPIATAYAWGQISKPSPRPSSVWPSRRRRRPSTTCTWQDCARHWKTRTAMWWTRPQPAGFRAR